MNFLLKGGSFLLGFVADIAKGYFDDWKAAKENTRAINTAVAENKVRLATSAQEFNQAWEMAALQGKDDALRRASFIIWVSPLVWGLFDPVGVQAYFKALTVTFPEWYVYGFLGMNAAIWGLTSLKNVRGAFTTIPTSENKNE